MTPSQRIRFFALLRTLPGNRLCGFRVGRLHIYVLDGALHLWRRGVHRFWRLPGLGA
jgi:hypothetical protein